MARYSTNPEFGKNRKSLDNELDEVEQERIRRQGHGLDTEDQDARYENLKEARDRLN